MIRALYWKAHRFRRETYRFWRILDSFRSMSETESQRILQNRLFETIDHFATRPDALVEWRELAKIKNPTEFWSAWKQLPIVTKHDLQTRFNPANLKEIGVKGSISSTGGSTGEPTPFVHDSEMIKSNYACSLYARRAFGWTFGMPTIVIWGSERDIGKQISIKNRSMSILRNEWLVDGYSMSEQTIDRVLELIKRHKRVSIWGFSSLLEFVATKVLERKSDGSRNSVVAAWNGGEMLFDTQSELFQKAFGVPISNMYGGRELSTMAFQERPAMSLRVMRPLLFVEIVDEDGNPVKPGEVGRLVWTSTVSRSTPFLRYEIGDIGSAELSNIDKSGIHSLSTLQGRTGGLINLTDGQKIGGLFWNHLFKDYPEVKRFQVAIITQRKIVLRLVGQGFSVEREIELRKTLESFLKNVEIEIAWLESISLTKQGKLLQVVNERPS